MNERRETGRAWLVIGGLIEFVVELGVDLDTSAYHIGGHLEVAASDGLELEL